MPRIRRMRVVVESEGKTEMKVHFSRVNFVPLYIIAAKEKYKQQQNGSLNCPLLSSTVPSVHRTLPRRRLPLRFVSLCRPSTNQSLARARALSGHICYIKLRNYSLSPPPPFFPFLTSIPHCLSRCGTRAISRARFDHFVPSVVSPTAAFGSALSLSSPASSLYDAVSFVFSFAARGSFGELETVIEEDETFRTFVCRYTRLVTSTVCVLSPQCRHWRDRVESDQSHWALVSFQTCFELYI